MNRRHGREALAIDRSFCGRAELLWIRLPDLSEGRFTLRMHFQDGIRSERARRVQVERSEIRHAAERSREGRHNGFAGQIRAIGRIKGNGDFDHARFADAGDRRLQMRVI